MTGGRQLSVDGTSRVTVDGQARFREGLGVKFPGATRPSDFVDSNLASTSESSTIAAVAYFGAIS